MPPSSSGRPTRSARTASRDRLDALRRYDILDTEPEDAFDTIAELAAHALDAEAGLVSFVDADRQWVKAAYGLTLPERSLDACLCRHALDAGRAWVVEDLSADERFSAHPLVTEGGFRFYAAAPLLTPDGHAIGSVCVLSRPPTTASDEERARLEKLARMAVDELELRRENARRRATEADLRAAEQRYRTLFEDAEEAILIHDLEGTITDANQQAATLFGLDVADALEGRTLFDLHPADTQIVPRQKLRTLRRRERYGVVTEYRRTDGARFWGHLSAGTVDVEGTVVVRSMIRNVTDERRARRLQSIQSSLFEALATGADPHEVLTRISHFVEDEIPGSLVSILRRAEGRLHLAAAPSFPASVVDPIDGTEIGPSAGSCGTAAHANRAVVTEDIRVDARWSAHRARAEAIGLRSCWSWPIRGRDGAVLGTFGIYGRAPRRPGAYEKRLMRRLAHGASVVLEQTQKDHELRRRREQLQTIFDNVPAMIGIFDAGGVPQLINQCVADVLGWSPSAVAGRSDFLAMMLPDPEAREEVRRFLESAANEWREFELTAADGKTVPARGTVVSLSDGRRIAIGLDVRAEKERQRRLRLLEAATEHTRLPILITEAAPLDPPGPRIEYANPAFAEVTGYDRDETLGQTPRLLQGPKTDEAALGRIRAALEADVPVREIVRNYRKDGSPYWNDLYIAPVRCEGGTVTHYVSIQDDVSERVRRVEALEQAKEEAEEAARLKSALLSNMNHEFRTPLTSIISFSQLLEQSPELAETFAGRIHSGGRRLLRTLNTVMDFAELEGGGATPTPQAFDARTVVQKVAGSFRRDAERTGLDLTTEMPDAPVTVVLDQYLVERIGTHLVSNGIKFTEEGTVTLGVRTTRAGVELWVEDTGIGMTPAVQARAHEEFVQASTGDDRTHEGNGLGLTIVRRFAERMGGHVEIESTPGTGTCVTVRLPHTA